MLCSTADGTGYSRRRDTTHESNLNVRHAALITNFPIYIACLRTLCMTHEMFLTNTTTTRGFPLHHAMTRFWEEAWKGQKAHQIGFL